MKQVTRTWAEIDLDNLVYNFKQLKALTSSGVLMMPVVKADAYGHGERPVALTLQQSGCDWFGVSNIIEARNLRKYGIVKPILILGYTPAASARDLFELSLTQTIYSEEYAEALAEQARQDNVVVDVHIKLDTGMSRLGFTTGNTEDLVITLARICYLPNIRVTGIFTHFAAADDLTDVGLAQTTLQHRRFATVLTEMTRRGFQFKNVHCANSAAVLNYPEYNYSMVRPGISLYGFTPNGKHSDRISLKPVMTLKTVVAQVKNIRAGEKISYGGTFTATGDMTIATLPIGYADGLPRILSNRGYAYVNDKVVPIIGRVCMDYTMIDVTGLSLRMGDEVALFGDHVPIGADNVAGIANTINYEIVTEIARRVERVYIQNGAIVDRVDYAIAK